MKGSVINLTRFCTDDGPGIRTTVFLKGCPLKCLWCHNPESQKLTHQAMCNKEKCIMCGACASVCPMGCHSFTEGEHNYSSEKCIGCGACKNVCKPSAIEISGSFREVDDIILEIKKDEVFYKTSGGGVTISGGEPLLQAKFSLELLKKCKENGIHTAMETSGYGSDEDVKSIIPYLDTVLFDIKETDGERHLRYTGVSQDRILNNLRLFDKGGVKILLRLPLIPDINDRQEHFIRIKEIKDSLKNCCGAQIMPYHDIGAYKYGQLGMEYSLKSTKAPTKEAIEAFERIIR